MVDDDGVPTADARKGMRRARDAVAAPSRPRRIAALRLHRPGVAPVDVAVEDDRRWVVGRHDAAEIVFDAPKVSRVHGTLLSDGGRWTFADAGSSNGTIIRKALVELRVTGGERAPLEVGDVIVVGDPSCRIELLDTPPAAAVHVERGPGRAFDERITLAARTSAPVFLLGASGSGKTFTARALHDKSGVAGAFISLNCARLPTDALALHSELLGHRKGAYTGATADRVGALFAAHGGTLFLDEVESLAPAGQGFLLDVLEGSGDPAPLGAPAGTASRPSFRVISASKKPLSASGLRGDLCERLASGHLFTLPSLDERRAEIPELIAGFLDEASRLAGRPVALTDEALAEAVAAAWPGQIRQLRAAISTLAQLAVARLDAERPAERALIRREDLLEHLAARASAFAPAPQAVETAAAERRGARVLTAAEVRSALARNNFNQSAAARELGIARNTLIKKMHAFGIEEGS